VLSTFLAVALSATVETPVAHSTSAGNAVAVDPLGRGTWVVDEDEDAVWLVPVSGEPQRFPVAKWPQRLVVDSQGRVFVSCREGGSVDMVDEALHVHSLPVGAEPLPLALDESAHTLYVGLFTEHALAAVDTQSLRVERRRSVDGEPQALAVMPNGIAILPRRGDTVQFSTRDFDPTLDRFTRLGKEEAGEDTSGLSKILTQDVFFRRGPVRVRHAWHGQALVPAGDFLLALHAAVETGLDGPAVEGGYGGGVSLPVRSVATVLHDEGPLSLVPVVAQAVLREDLGTEPASATRTEGHPGTVREVDGASYDNGLLALTARGSGKLVVGKFDWQSAAWTDVAAVTLGAGAAGAVFDGAGQVHAFSAFGRDAVTARYVAPRVVAAPYCPPHEHPEVPTPPWLGIPDPRQPHLSAQRRQTVPTLNDDPELALGRALFYRSDDRRMSGAGLACAVCHPDGREDGLVWRVKGNRRQTPELTGRLAATAPYNWEGSSASLDASLKQTLQRLGGTGLRKRERQALARYLLEGLHPVSRPAQDMSQQWLVSEGRAIFHDSNVGCSSCHDSAHGFTDGLSHNVESLSAGEAAENPDRRGHTQVKAFDTPSLRDVALTAPYFHDGSALTLEALLEKNQDRMGNTSQLTPEQRQALVAYLRTL
jgi:cytochrome c peroxidase